MTSQPTLPSTPQPTLPPTFRLARQPIADRAGRTVTRRTAAGIAASVVLLAGCSGSDGPSYRPAEPPAVAIKVAGLDREVRLGVLVSGSGAAGQGSDLLGRAAGARVAAYRLQRGGVRVRLDVVDDQGTAAGATRAMAGFVKDGVSGVVALTSGSHLLPSLTVAGRADLAVLLPYDPTLTAPTAWRTGPTSGQVRQALAGLLARQGLTAPYVLHGDGLDAEVDGLAPPGRDRALGATESPVQVAAPIIAAARARAIDSVVLAASPQTQAALVAQLQGGAPTLDLVLTPQATGPVFGQLLADRLADDGTATTSGAFTAVGVAGSDATGAGPAPLAFLTALRLAAQDTSVRSLLQPDVSFDAQGAATADTASHDAVLALVHAVAKAGSATPAAVRTALATLKVGTGQGLAGRALDFTDPTALPDDAVVSLASTTQDLGGRQGVAEALPPLTWFVLPAAKG